MRRPSMRAAALAAAVALAAAAAAPAAAQDGGGSDSLDETKVIQGLTVSLSAAETMAREGSPFSLYPEPAEPFDEWRLSSSVQASYSLSFRARGVSGQVSAWAEAAASEDLDGAISQAWIKASFGEGWALSFGRHSIDWKDGGNWNPSDVANYRMSWNQEGEEPGRDSIELIGLIPFTDFVLDINAATVFSKEYDDLEELPLYLAAGTILYPFELRAKAALQAGRLPILGAALKLSLTGVDLYGDLAWFRDHPLAGEIDGTYAAEEGSWLRFCVGGTWSTDISRSKIAKSLSLQLEYLRQDDGLTAAQGEEYFAELASEPELTWGTLASKWAGRFFALYRDYALAALSIGDIGNAHLGLSASGLVNIDDGSAALRGTLYWSPKNLITLSLGATGYVGPEGSEAEALPEKLSLSFALSKSF